MAHCRLTLIFLLQCLFLININCDTDVHENLDEFYRPQIWSLVNYLNTHPSRIYNYNYATLINAQNKDLDYTDLTIDVEVDCRNYRPNKCITSLLECTGTVKYNTDTANYEVITASCSPKTRVDHIRNEETTPRLETESPVEETALYETNAERQPVSEEPISQSVAPCVGCPSDINTNVEGLNLLTDVALNHIESERNNKHVIVRIIRAQRQVVAGLKYILLLEVVPTDCPKTVDEQALHTCRLLSDYSQICEVTYYQRPWISRIKSIIANNCTNSQEFNPEPTPIPANDQDNEIDKNYYPGKPVGYPERVENEDRTNYDSIANGNTDEMLRMTGEIIDNDRLRDIESQIVFLQPRTEEAVESETEVSTVNLNAESFPDLTKFFGDELRSKRAAQNNDDDSSSSSSSSSEEDNDNNGDNNNNEFEKTKRKYKKYEPRKNDNNNDDDSSSSSSSSSSEEDNNDDEKKHKSAKKTKRQALSSESNETSEEKQISTAVPVAENKVSSEESSEEHRGGVRRKRSLGQTEEMVKISPEERTYVQNLADFSASTLDDIDSDNHRRIVLQVLGAKKNIAGTLYHLTLRVGISKCTEDDTQVLIDLHKPNRRDENCRHRLIENLTKICKVQIKVDADKTNPRVEKSHCQNIKKDSEDTNINRTNKSRSKRGGERLVGGINTVSPDDPKIVEYVTTLLQQLDANEGVSNARQLVRVVSATKQTVAGVRYRLNVEFTLNDKKTICDFDVWDQAWLKDGKSVKVKCDGEQEEKKYRFKRSHPDMMLGKDDHDVHIGIFKSFMNKFDKKYPSKAEFKRRFTIFRQNMKTIKELNDKEQGTAKYGATQFADLTKEEYKQYLGLNPALQNPNNIPMPQARIPNIDIPVEFDWRKKGVISEVKNQGQCGSCWAFSVTGNIEGLNAIKTGNLVELSEQELVDCDTLDAGCNGGLPDNAYRAIEQIGGLETETDYPYEAENEKCAFNKTLSRVQISGSVNISSNETDMAKWLVNNGPISIGINANAMQFYMGGVSHPWKFLCDPTNLDHGVLIVGYGVHKYPLFKKTYPYWIVKNSWGPSWGEQGYYRVYRGDGTCGVNMMATSAVL